MNIAANDYISAILIGLTYGNLWVCALLVFSLQTAKKNISLGFLIGRTLAILSLAMVISFAGKRINIPFYILHIVSGVVIIVYAVIIICKHILVHHSDPKTASHNNNCAGDCEHCAVKTLPEYNRYCDDCTTDCLYESSEFRYIENAAAGQTKRNKNENNIQKSGFLFGASVGVLRGGVLCSKLLILAPILTASNLTKSLIISLLFIFSSSIYPILGMFLGKLALRLVKFKRVLFIGSSIGLTLVGIFYIYQGAAIIVSNIG